MQIPMIIIDLEVTMVDPISNGYEVETHKLEVDFDGTLRFDGDEFATACFIADGETRRRVHASVTRFVDEVYGRTLVKSIAWDINSDETIELLWWNDHPDSR